MVIIWRFPMGDPHLYGWFMEKYGWFTMEKNEKKTINGKNLTNPQKIQHDLGVSPFPETSSSLFFSNHSSDRKTPVKASLRCPGCPGTTLVRSANVKKLLNLGREHPQLYKNGNHPKKNLLKLIPFCS